MKTKVEQKARFGASADQISAARRWVAGLLADAADPTGRDVMVSEVATNALRHTRSAKAGFQIVVTVDGRTARVEVLDAGGVTDPVARPESTTREGGRGIALLDALSAGWGWRERPEGGRVVWFNVPLT